MLFERVKPSQSPDSLKANKIIATGAAFGSYIALSTVVFFIMTTRTDFISVRTCHPYYLCDFLVPNLINSIWQHIIKARLLVGHDEVIKSALFLQMSIVNHAIGLFAHSRDGHCSGPIVTISSVLSQLVSYSPAQFPPQCDMWLLLQLI